MTAEYKIGENIGQNSPERKTAYRITYEKNVKDLEQSETDWAEKLAFLVPKSVIPAERRKKKIEELTDFELEALGELINENRQNMDDLVTKQLAPKVGRDAWIGNWNAGERPDGYVSIAKKMRFLLPTQEERIIFLQEAGIDVDKYNKVLKMAKLGLMTKDELEFLLKANAQLNSRLAELEELKKGKQLVESKK